MPNTRRVATIVTLGLVGAFAGVTAASAGGGCHTGVTEGHDTTVEMVEACFTPTVLFIDPDESVDWVNRSGIVHNITANMWGHFDDIGGGQRVTMRFDDEGTYPYACTYHPGMSGVVVVGDGDGPGNGDAISVSSVDATGTDEPSPAADAVLASTPLPADDRWIGSGVVGLVIGVALGTAVATVRRRAAASSTGS